MILNKNIRFVPLRRDSASLSLAIDDALLSEMDRKIKGAEKVDPILRVYQFSSPAVILGWNQSATGRFDEGISRDVGARLLMRRSGGGHMFYTPDDFHYSFIVPKNLLQDCGESIEGAYCELNGLVVEALKRCGFEAKLGITSIRNSQNKIVCGTAQRRTKHCILLHGGIITNPYNEHVYGILMADSREVEKWKERVSNVPQDKAKHFPEKIEKLFSASYCLPLTVSELAIAEKGRKEFYENKKVIYSGNVQRTLCLLAEKGRKDKEGQEDNG